MSAPERKTPPFWISFLGGLAGGIGDTLFNYPPYGIHIRKERREILTRKHLHPLMMYCGATAYGVGMIPATVVQLVMTNTVNDHLPRPVAAFIGGIFGALIYTPVGNIIVNQQKLMPVTPTTYVTMSKAINYIKQRHGMKRFWAGLVPTMGRDGLYSMSVFWAYDKIKQHFDYIQSTIVKYIVIAAVLGTITSFISHPLDAIATRIQDHEEPITSKQMARKMWQEGKIRSFYRGALFRCYAVFAGILVVENISSHVEKLLM